MLGYIIGLIVIEISIELTLSEFAMQEITNYYIIAIESYTSRDESRVSKKWINKSISGYKYGYYQKKISLILESIKDKIAYKNSQIWILICIK